jgi:hypothetical protein
MPDIRLLTINGCLVGQGTHQSLSQGLGTGVYLDRPGSGNRKVQTTFIKTGGR